MTISAPAATGSVIDPAFTRASALLEPLRLTDKPFWVGHIPFGFWCIETFKPRRLVELGTETGVSFCAFNQAIDYFGINCESFAVDTWAGDSQTGAYDDTIYDELRAYHDPLYGRFGRLVRERFEEAVHRFDDGSIDLLHIDGLHTYEAVKLDFETWKPKLSARGIILFHDVAVRESTFGVHRFFDEIKGAYPHFLFPHSNGLGVLAVGVDVDPAMRVLFDAQKDDARQAAIRAWFARLGATYQRQMDAKLAALALAKKVELEAQSQAKSIAERDLLLGAEYARRDLAHEVEAGLRLRLAEVENELGEYRQRLGAYTTQGDDLRQEIERLRSDMAASHNELGEYRQKLGAASATSAGLEQAMERLRHDIAAKDQEIAQLNQALGSYATQLDALKQVEAAAHQAQAAHMEALAQRDYAMERLVDSTAQALINLEREIEFHATVEFGLKAPAKTADGALMPPLPATRDARIAWIGLYLAALSNRIADMRERAAGRHGDFGDGSSGSILSVTRPTRPSLLQRRMITALWRMRGAPAPAPIHIREANALVTQELIDLPYYCEAAGQLFPSIEDALRHYLDEGADRGLSPHPLFDPKFYHAQLTDGDLGELTLAGHFALIGLSRGLNPHPLFQCATYAAAARDPAAAAAPIAHYQNHGRLNDLSPHPLFDPKVFNAACQKANVLERGLAAYVSKKALFTLAPHSAFDPVHYFRAYPQVAALGLNPLIHYVTTGDALGYRPNPDFSAAAFRRDHKVEPGRTSLEMALAQGLIARTKAST